MEFLTITDGQFSPRKKIKTSMISFTEISINGKDEGICPNFEEWASNKAEELSNSWKLSGEITKENK